MGRTPSITALRDNSLGYGFLPRGLCRWVEGPLWCLDEDYTFTLAVPLCLTQCTPAIYTIPAGYEFDKASIPPLFWGPPLGYLPDGLCTLPALEHDYLCDLLTGGSDWLRSHLGELPPSPPAWMVHLHFRRRLHLAKVRYLKAEIMGRTVQAWGPQGWAWPWLYIAIGLTVSVFIHRFFS